MVFYKFNIFIKYKREMATKGYRKKRRQTNKRKRKQSGGGTFWERLGFGKKQTKEQRWQNVDVQVQLVINTV